MSKTPRFFALDFNNVEKKEKGDEAIFKMVRVIFNLPHENILEKNFPIGESVQTIKRYLNDNHRYPYQTTSFIFEGEMMIDPLSLNDYPKIVELSDNSEAIHIQVEGEQLPEPEPTQNDESSQTESDDNSSDDKEGSQDNE